MKIFIKDLDETRDETSFHNCSLCDPKKCWFTVNIIENKIYSDKFDFFHLLHYKQRIITEKFSRIICQLKKSSSFVSNFKFIFGFFFNPLNFAFIMIRINLTDVIFLNFVLLFSARDKPVLNSKNELKSTFYGA